MPSPPISAPMDPPLGIIVLLDAQEFTILDSLDMSSLAKKTESIREDVRAYEEWLANPPPSVDAETVQSYLRRWDRARQWLQECQERCKRGCEKKQPDMFVFTGGYSTELWMCSVCDSLLGCSCLEE